MQAWVAVMAWYVEKRRQAETEVARYAEPPSDALLPDHPPNMRCQHLLPVINLHTECVSHASSGVGDASVGEGDVCVELVMHGPFVSVL